MTNELDGDLREVLAEARAIYFAMIHGAITSQQAKFRTKPHLRKINKAIDIIAKKYNENPKHISFSDLGKNV